MKDKKSLYLAVILGLFLVLVGMISFVVFDSVKENNKVFINNEIQLGDSNCTDWGGGRAKTVEQFSGPKCPSTIPTSGNEEKYECYSEKGNNSTDCGGIYNTCYKVTTYTRKCNGSSTTPTSTPTDSCSVGEYKNGTSGCSKCPDGYTSKAGATSINNCYVSVPAGKQVTTSGGKAVSCDGNTISSSSRIVYYGSTALCSACGDGKIANSTHTACGFNEISCCYKENGKYVYGNVNSSVSSTKCVSGVSSIAACEKLEKERNNPTTKDNCNHQNEYWVNNKCVTCPNGYHASGSTTCTITVQAGYGLNTAGGTSVIACTGNTFSSDSREVQYGSISPCQTCPNGKKANSSHKGCYTPNSNPSTPTDKCYKDANNDYQVGNFNNQPGYTLVSNETKNCNNIKVKKVDSNKTVLTGATITFTDSSVPPVTRTFNIGETDINMTNPGTYTIVETVAPTGYQVDNTPIQVIVNDDGSINVTGGTNIDLGTSNGTRNITLSIVNSNGNSTPAPTVEEYCYVKRGNGTNNDYCYGNTDTNCVGFSEVVIGRIRETCVEDIACYQKTDGTYTVGKFDGQQGYQYFGTICPACYEDANGTYRWTNTPNANERPVPEINTIDKCVTPSKISGNKIIYIILIGVVGVALVFVLMSMKKGNSKNNMSTEY